MRPESEARAQCSSIDAASYVKDWPQPGPEAPRSDELIWIRTEEVTDWYKPDPENGAPRFRRRHSGLVAQGDWDLSRRPFGDHIKLNSIRDHFENGVPWEKTQLFDWMMQQLAEKGRIDSCTSKEDLVARYQRLDRIFDEAQATGTMVNTTPNTTIAPAAKRTVTANSRDHFHRCSHQAMIGLIR